MNKQASRDTGLDLLRIVCMVMVVCLHTLVWGGLVEGTLVPFTANWYVGNILQALSLPAVNGFVLISGYFLCTAKFKLKRLTGTWFQALFYSVALCLLVALLPGGNFSVTELIKSGMVMTMDRYWFVTDYLLLYILSPFLNVSIRHMTRRTHFLCCCVLLAVFSVLSNMVYICDFSGVNGGYSFLWFCVLYVLAAYIRLYVPKRVRHQKWVPVVFILCALTICGERFFAYFITPYIFGGVRLTSLFYSYNSIVAVPCALALFQTFRGLEIRSAIVTKGILAVAPLTFAVYLIHEQDNLRPLLWGWLDPGALYASPWMLPYVLLCVIGIFTACCLIEWVRRWLFKACRISALLDRISDQLPRHVLVKLEAWEEKRLSL